MPASRDSLPFMPLLRAAVLLLLLAAGRLRAQELVPVTDGEQLQPPTPARLAEFVRYGEHADWDKLTPMFHTAALSAYEKGKLPAAERWYAVYRWSALFAKPEAQFIPRWIKEMEAAQVVNANLRRRYVAWRRSCWASGCRLS